MEYMPIGCEVSTPEGDGILVDKSDTGFYVTVCLNVNNERFVFEIEDVKEIEHFWRIK